MTISYRPYWQTLHDNCPDEDGYCLIKKDKECQPSINFWDEQMLQAIYEDQLAYDNEMQRRIDRERDRRHEE